MRMRRLIPALLALAVVAGCAKESPPPEYDNYSSDTEESEPAELINATEPAAPEPKAAEPAPVTNFADELPEDKPLTPDQQMLDDADATGLTARLPPSDGAADPSAEGTAPSSGNGTTN